MKTVWEKRRASWLCPQVRAGFSIPWIQLHKPNGVESFSPALAVRARQARNAYAGWRPMKIINPEGVKWCGNVGGRG